MEDLIKDMSIEYAIDFINRIIIDKTEKIEGEIDFETRGCILTEKQVIELFGEKNAKQLKKFKAYKRFHCGCEHDCCGCISSLSVLVQKVESYFVFVITAGFNY